MDKEILEKIEAAVITVALILGIFFMVMHWR
jgi:hypothetical protein